MYVNNHIDFIWPLGSKKYYKPLLPLWKLDFFFLFWGLINPGVAIKLYLNWKGSFWDEKLASIIKTHIYQRMPFSFKSKAFKFQNYGFVYCPTWPIVIFFLSCVAKIFFPYSWSSMLAQCSGQNTGIKSRIWIQILLFLVVSRWHYTSDPQGPWNIGIIDIHYSYAKGCCKYQMRKCTRKWIANDKLL